MGQIRSVLQLSCLSKSILPVVITGVLSSCSDTTNITVDNTALRDLAADSGLTGDPAAGRTLPSIEDAKAQLGKELFFSKGLGGNDDAACVTCHHPMLGGGDDMALPVGVNAESPDLLGPGRLHDAAKALVDPDDGTGSEFDGGPTVPRNAPTTFNIALWDRVLFHDGRVESLGKTPGKNGDDDFGIRTPDSFDITTADPDAGANLTQAQARFPVTSPEEMKGFTHFPGDNAAVRTAIEGKLAANWGVAFAGVYDGDSTITYTKISEAIAEYERSQIFVDNPWSEYLAGDDTAISESAKRGAMLFFDSVADGGANCVTCHSGDFFTDEGFHVIAMPQVGRGKGDGDTGTDDFGRARETKNDSDRYRFRTPTLLNVEETGPYGHAGAYATLEATVRHHLNPRDAIENYDFDQLDDNVQTDDMLTNTELALQKLEADRLANPGVTLPDVELTDGQVADLVEFLKALTDPCVQDRECLAPWIADANDDNPDSKQLVAEDADGNLL